MPYAHLRYSLGGYRPVKLSTFALTAQRWWGSAA